MTLYELRKKDVIRASNGDNLGRADDLVFDHRTAAVSAVVLYGRPRLLGLAGRQPDLVIPWQQVKQVGNDILLVELPETEERQSAKRHSRFFGS